MTKFKFQMGLIFKRLSLNNMLMHSTASCNESHIKSLNMILAISYYCWMVLPFMLNTTLIDITGHKV